MLSSSEEMEPGGRVRSDGSRRGSDFVARTVSGVTEALERAVFDQGTAESPGLLQSLDARAKVVAAAALLLSAGLARSLSAVLLAEVLVLVLARLSGLPLVVFLRRVWLGIPLLAAFVAAPSLTMIPGRPLLLLLDVPPLYLAISDNAVASAVLFVARVGTSVSIVLLLICTTRWAELLRALRALKTPESMVVVLGMTYRYLFLFLHAANSLFLARASRTVGHTSGAEQRRWTAGAAGTLMGRSIRMSSEVLLAMRARGFSGEMRAAAGPRMRDQDWLTVALAVGFAAISSLMEGWLS